MHPTLLPRHRGRAPIPWAILTGLARTGVTLFEIVDATRRLRVDRRPGHARHRARRDCDDALCAHRRRARRADARAPAAAPRGHGSAHPAGSEPRELLAEAHSRRRDHRLGDEGAVPLRLGAGADAPVPGRLHVSRGREGDRLERAAGRSRRRGPSGHGRRGRTGRTRGGVRRRCARARGDPDERRRARSGSAARMTTGSRARGAP